MSPSTIFRTYHSEIGSPKLHGAGGVNKKHKNNIFFCVFCACGHKMKYLILYIASLALGGAGAWLVSRWGSGFGLLDKANHRSSHKGVVPKGGGIGILAAFLLASWMLGLPVLFWVCAGLISFLSLYGDHSEISPKVRLGIQLLGSVGLLFGLFYWEGRGWPVRIAGPTRIA